MSKIAEQIFENAKEEQELYPTMYINVGYGFNRNEKNLKEVMELAKADIRKKERYVKYGICSEQAVEQEIKVLEQLQKSCLNTIKMLKEF